MAESYKAVLNGHVEGLLIDAFVAGSMEEMLAGQDVYVKRVIDRSLSYCIVLSGQAVRLESACREYIAMHKAEIIDQIKTNVKVLDLQTRQNSSVSVHRHQVGEEPVVSFEVVLFIVCSLLGGCVMLGLVWQIRYTTRRKPEVNPDIPQLSDIPELRGMVRETHDFVNPGESTTAAWSTRRKS
ncbi:uncharacterized protein LOC116619246 [Nematostella vectensis]|uniref:uncharacterized protein LOC116619246 n=1 Tax=Nematostella vectensis TaxID=45351 RepID=UPI00207794B9|nr:uncharacterized protein LOC116619246 [Nematostella vectensis]